MAKARAYIPPLSFDRLTPLYDRLIPLLMPETPLKRRLIEQAQIECGEHVLDLGAGTATLTVMIKQAHPGVDVTGLDADPKALSIGRAKAAAAGVAIRLDQGIATDLPYDDASFDHVFSSLMLHHLATQDKLRALVEVQRVLRPGGEMHILDFGSPNNIPNFLVSLVMRHLEQVGDNIRGLLPQMMRQAGFAHIEETGRQATILGTLSLYRARRQV